jgi:quinol monooxygenase YgiN
MAIVRINEFHAVTGKATALLEFLRAVIDVVKGSSGCHGCQLLVDAEDDLRLAIVETWDSIAAHQAAAGKIPPEKLAEVMPLLATPPQGRYYRADPTA